MEEMRGYDSNERPERWDRLNPLPAIYLFLVQF